MNSVTGIGMPLLSPGPADSMTVNLNKNKDTDFDWVLSAAELAESEDILSEIDVNGDGQADLVELTASSQIARIIHMTTGPD